MNRIPGVISAQVDVTGRHFVIIPGAEAIEESAIDQAIRILGPNSRDLKDPEFENPNEEYDLEEIWLTADNIRSLSLLEARILANNWGRSAAADADLPDDLALRLASRLRLELTKEFDRIHAQGGTMDRNWYRRAFPAAFERAVHGLSGLSGSQAGCVRDSLLRSLNK
ncbi:MAG TPA: hypothetical protein VE398_06345 [Acidobacteriota bacterium]|nr:hypothetical protein [Acidobacteriota bacterium]